MFLHFCISLCCSDRISARSPSLCQLLLAVHTASRSVARLQRSREQQQPTESAGCEPQSASRVSTCCQTTQVQWQRSSAEERAQSREQQTEKLTRLPLALRTQLTDSPTPVDAVMSTTLPLRDRVTQMQAALRLDFEPEALPGRERQQKALRDFLARHVQTAMTGGSLYVSGRPGTGKTASVDHVVHSMFGQRLEGDGRGNTAAAASSSSSSSSRPSAKKKLLASASAAAPTIMYINAMRLPKPSDLYRRLLAIAQGLGAASEQSMPPASESMDQLRMMLCPKDAAAASRATGSYLIVVDEVDALLTGPAASVLYELLEWPHRPHSRVAVICISNEINLLEQKLPGLERRNAVPLKLVFTTYAAPELLKIAKQRCDAVERRQAEAAREPVAQTTTPLSIAARGRAEAAAVAASAASSSSAVAASSSVVAASPSKRTSRSAAAAGLCASPEPPASSLDVKAGRGRKRKTTALPTAVPVAKEDPEPIVTSSLVAPLRVRVDTPSSMDTTEIGEPVASPVAAATTVDADPCVTPKKARRAYAVASPAASPSAASACASPLASPASSSSALSSPSSAATAASPSASAAAASSTSLFSSDALEWLCKNVAGPGGGDLRKVLKTMSTCLDRLMDMHEAVAEGGEASNSEGPVDLPQQVSFSLMRSVLPPSMGGALEQQTMLRALPVQQKVVLIVGALLRELHGRDHLHAFHKLYNCFCAHFELHPAKGAEYDDLLQNMGNSLIEIVAPRRNNSGGVNRGGAPRAAPGSGSSTGSRGRPPSIGSKSATALCGILVRVSVDTLRSVWHEDKLMQRLLSNGAALVNSILAANQIAAARNHEDYRQRDLETP